MIRNTTDWLASLRLDGLASLFVEQEIDLDAARELTEDDLKELGLPMGPRKKLVRVITELQASKGIEPGPGLQALPPDTDPKSESQSRQVTILFSDISGFTKLSLRGSTRKKFTACCRPISELPAKSSVNMAV